MTFAMLFVQMGVEPPRVVARRSLSSVHDALTGRSKRMKDSAQLWWVVECKTADAGRETIANGRGAPVGGRFQSAGPGRILASGGKR